MAIYQRGEVWWYEFMFAGRRIRESAKTSRKTIARESERVRRLELEKTLAGMPIEKRENRINRVQDVVREYPEHYPINHRPKSVIFSKQRLIHVSRLLGSTLLPDLTEQAVRRYIKTRLGESAGGRTINMELGELSRAIGKPWSVLWPKVRKLEELKDVGKALSADEEKRLLDACLKPHRRLIGAFVRIALLTGMRAGEILGLTWGRVDLMSRVLTVGRAKSSSGTGRQIPLNEQLFQVLASHAEWFAGLFGETKPEYYLFPFGSPLPTDPSRPVTDLSRAWDSLREDAKVSCRFHDLRHTVATKMAEAGVPESTMLALLGHMSRAMLERYSHIRLKAKRQAMESLNLPSEGQIQDEAPTKSPTVEPVAAVQ